MHACLTTPPCHHGDHRGGASHVRDANSLVVRHDGTVAQEMDRGPYTTISHQTKPSNRTNSIRDSVSRGGGGGGGGHDSGDTRRSPSHMLATLPQRAVPTHHAYPVEVKAIRYGLLSRSDIHRLSVLPCRRVIGPVIEYGVNDTRLGVCDRLSSCATCGLRSVDCVGHAGHIDLEAPVFHVGFFAAVLRICRTICKTCAHVLLTREEMDYYDAKLRSSRLEPAVRAALVKKIQTEAYKTRVCVHCGALNGTVRRARPLRMIHEKLNVELRRGDVPSSAHSAGPAPRESFLRGELAAAVRRNGELVACLPHIHDFLDPARVRQLFLAIPAEQRRLLGLEPHTAAEDLIATTLLVPAVCVRPRGLSAMTGSSAAHIREDDLTTQYNDILLSSDALREGSSECVRYVENWDLLQTRVARLMDAALPGFAPHQRAASSSSSAAVAAAAAADCKSYAQRLKGKHGRFRGNLNGKRVDFSGRSVISPDPNLAIDELAVPLRVARVLTYPQRVFAHNVSLMRRLVLNGPQIHPGALTVYFAREKSRKPLSPHNRRERAALAARLRVGDVVQRHVMNDDLILFNRQPSLHRISMMAHRARVLPHRTFRFNECCCSPYNADFDGDEMNVHVVQTEEARAEAKELMLTARNILTARNGEPIIACTQDFLTAAYLLTARDVFLDRAQFTQMASHWLGGDDRGESGGKKALPFVLPTPALLKPVELWTGKQAIELVLRPRRRADDADAALLVRGRLSFEAKTRFYSGRGKHDDVAEGYVGFLDSVYLAGRMDKKLLGGGAKDGLFARLHAQCGGLYTATCMARMARLTSRYLQHYGFSLGLGDVAPTAALLARRQSVLQRALADCHALIARARADRLPPLPGMTAAQTLEAHLNRALSTVRDDCGVAAVDTLDAAVNAPLIMLNSGSKGSALNTAQMMSCVGQQTVNGCRIVNAFDDRSLPHFVRFAEHPAARGFVASSFYAGLSPTEFYFHTMAGREGLVDTAVKTAETGYIYRRLSKAMENLAVGYDGAVRNGTGGAVIQLRYGEDGLDPWGMEGAGGGALNLAQEWHAVRAREARRAATLPTEMDTKTDADEVAAWRVLSLLPDEAPRFVADCLDAAPAALSLCQRHTSREESARRRTTKGEKEEDEQEEEKHTEGVWGRQLTRFATWRSGRFRADVCAFIAQKSREQARLRGQLGLAIDAYALVQQVHAGAADSAIAAEEEEEEEEEKECNAPPTRRRRVAAAAARRTGRRDAAPSISPPSPSGTPATAPNRDRMDGQDANSMDIVKTNYTSRTMTSDSRSRSRSRSRRRSYGMCHQRLSHGEETGASVGDVGGSVGVPAPHDAAALWYSREQLQTTLMPMTRCLLAHFVLHCANRYVRKMCEAGTPCGAIAAQSVGEPSTQMTLRTFHFAGVASMNITQGVPRLVEVINANRHIATPVITAPVTTEMLDSCHWGTPYVTARKHNTPDQTKYGNTRGTTNSDTNNSAHNTDTMNNSNNNNNNTSRKHTNTSDDTDSCCHVGEAKDRHGWNSPLLAPAHITRLPHPQQRLYRTSRLVKALLERVLLKEVTREVAEVIGPRSHYLQIFLHTALIERLMLPVNACVVRERVLAAAARPMSPLRLLRPECVEVVAADSLIVWPYESDPQRVHMHLQSLLSMLPEVMVCGMSSVNRVMIARQGAELLAEGTELRAVMALPHVDGTRTCSNHVAVVERALGVEAAREVVVREINNVLKAYALSIDIRHVYLLADVMTSRGVVLGITRYGIEKMCSNALTMASFERTTEHLYNAAMMQRVDSQLSVSDSVILGKPVPLGTSACEIILDPGSAVREAETCTRPLCDRSSSNHTCRGNRSGGTTNNTPDREFTSHTVLTRLGERTRRSHLPPPTQGLMQRAYQKYALGEGLMGGRLWGHARVPLYAQDTFHVDVLS